MVLPSSLVSLAAVRDGVLTRRDILAAGYSPDDIGRWHADGELRPIWRGIFGTGPSPDDEVGRHAERAVALSHAYGERAVISHHSALIVADLPTYGVDLSTVRMLRRNRGDSLTAPGVRFSRSRVDFVAHVDRGVRRVHEAVAIAQVAVESGIEAAVVSGDAALRSGIVDREQLVAGAQLLGLIRHGGRPMRAVELMDGRSESPGESLLRLIAVREGIDLEPQYVVHNTAGEFVARCDFRVVGARVLVEFDGKVKYQGTMDGDRRVKHAAGNPLFAEKQREDALRRLGWRVVRFVWADLADPAGVVARLRAET
jgi:hypothetical protein